MEIKTGKFVAATYDLFVGGEGETPELMEQATTQAPLTFISGTGQMLEAFEDNLAGMKVGSKFDFVIPAENAYGEYDDEHVMDLPRNMFEVDGVFDDKVIFAGNVIPMMDNMGNRMNASVVEVKEDVVVLDFNHPLAGETLHFIGEVLEVRDATEVELAALTSGGGCGSGGCGSCGSGGCGTEEDEHEHEHAHAGGGCGSGCGCH
ncbi:MAG: FKBP-type peptidyl-prolyl cis-trans isomerase [Bacteroidales bacterium]|nr:FKBP-type peptidyl-prolyl cis-trans isomerase [Bacteroidales bacterium]